MFDVAEIERATGTPEFAADVATVHQALVELRLHRPILFDAAAADRLTSFVNAVLASAPRWTVDHSHIVQQAAQIAETLAASETIDLDHTRYRLRAALLYELAGMPMMAAAVVHEDDGPSLLVAFFKRREGFGALNLAVEAIGLPLTDRSDIPLRYALCDEAIELGAFEHADEGPLDLTFSGPLRVTAANFALDLTLTEIKAFEEVIARRAARATLRAVPRALGEPLRGAAFPAELWQPQASALDAGLLDRRYDAWGFAAPTGTGKTFLARLLVIDALAQNTQSKVLYVVPSKALVYQITSELKAALSPLSIDVTAVTPQLVALDEHEDDSLRDADVLVLTPEKADLLLRIGAGFLSSVSLVVIDEAHHIENDTRGVLLELYLARLRARFAGQARYVFLSAVAPNIKELANWVGDRPQSLLYTQRATRMKAGVYRVRKTDRGREGWIEYTDGSEVAVIPDRVETGQAKGLVQLARALGVAGPVLVVAKGKGTAETLAEKLDELLEGGERPDLSADGPAESIQRLDSRLEREMYAGVKLRRLIRSRVAYHHAGLPPRVREALEEAIREGHIRYVVATTTLAEGVNFPFSSVIVQALAVREGVPKPGTPVSYRIFTPRTFWNIAGRAGRPGFDHEGQVILYEPSLGLDKVDVTLDPYINPSLEDFPPVTSALAEGLTLLSEAERDGTLGVADTESVELPEHIPPRVHGVVNLVRVGIAHARASGIASSADEFFDTTLAAKTLDGHALEFAREFFIRQGQVVDAYLASDDAPTPRLVAELGLSLDTLSRLRNYVRGLKDWQVENMASIIVAGRIRFDPLRYLLSPVLARMAELEGPRLGALYTELVIDWCMGKPFSAIPPLRKHKRLEDLINLMYTKIQFLLPWGLYAFDRFVEEEAAQRGAAYHNEVRDLAYLVDAGVPDVPALILVTAHGFERTDATRLSRGYYADREARETANVMGWIAAQPNEVLAGVVRGVDNRRIDYDFFTLVERLR